MVIAGQQTPLDPHTWQGFYLHHSDDEVRFMAAALFSNRSQPEREYLPPEIEIMRTGGGVLARVKREEAA